MFVTSTDRALRERLTRHIMDNWLAGVVSIHSLRWEGHSLSDTLIKLKVPVLIIQSTTARESLDWAGEDLSKRG